MKIMNDQCHERFLKFVQVTLSVPGSSALQGESGWLRFASTMMISRVPHVIGANKDRTRNTSVKY